MTDIDVRLREDVHLLGELLGETIRQQHGEAFLQKIEDILTQAYIDIGHRPSLRRGSPRIRSGTLPKSAHGKAVLASRFGTEQLK